MATKDVKPKGTMKPKKSWSEKIKKEQAFQLKKIDFSFADIPANSNMFIATPYIINEYIKQIPKGKSVDIKTIRKDLAAEYHADYTCPLTTGIFLRIVAEAAYEEYKKQKSLKNITPFWRAIAPKSSIAQKLSFGEKFLIQQREKEHITDIKSAIKKRKK